MSETTTLENSIDHELYRHLSADDLHEAVSIVLKLRGETCNIDCLYCFEKRKESPGGATVDVANLALLGEMFGAKPLAVELHGGEPLTTPRERMREILDQLARMPTVIAVTLQTNGTLLDHEWIDLFDEHLPSIQLAISLDGDPDANAWRVTYNGEQTHRKVEEAIRLLAARGRTVGVTTVVTSRAIGRCTEIMDYLTGFDNVRAINLIPCFDTAIRRPTTSGARRVPPSRKLQQDAIAGQEPPNWSTAPADYAEFVLEAARYWVERGLWRRIQLAPVVAVIRRLRGLDVRNCHFSARKCDHVFTAYPEGRLGSCDELPWPQAQLFAAGTRPSLPLALAAQAASPLLTSARSLMAKCTTCDYQQTCGGGCVSHRLSHAATHGHDDAYCDHRMRLVNGVAGLLAAPGHRLATACREVRWSPQHPNTMLDVKSFLDRWGNPDVERVAAALLRSSAGNINTLGSTEVCEADDLDPLHPQWRGGIETDVWPLVEVITDAGFVTYDSCEGPPTGARELAMKGVRVGILARNSDDAARISAILCHAVTNLQQVLPAEARIRACRGYLRCETSGRDHPVVDLRVEPSSSNAFEAFYATRESSVRSVVSALAAATNANLGDGCACMAASASSTQGSAKLIHIAETIAVQSIEKFLADDEVDVVRTAMAEITAVQGVAPFDADRQSTMHAVPGLNSSEVMAVYEPNGRLEITDLPEAVTATLEAALKRAMPAINRIMPSITRCHPWVYVEYRPGQFITPHVDNIAPEPSAWPRQVAGIGVLIEPATAGGEFYVETTGDDRLWADPPIGIPGYAPGMAIAREGSDYSSADYRSMPRTRWNVTPSVGTALLYGSQLTHGTEPVASGVCRKFINWLVCDEPH